MRTVETDVAVIGSGCAGMAAAYTAAKAGLRVDIFEKAAVLGGPTKGAHGPFAIGTAMQRERQISLSKSDAFQMMMDHTNWRSDARLVSEYINRSAQTVEWMQELGINFTDVVAYFDGAQYTWHFKDPASPHITEAIFAKAQEYGARIHLGHPALRLTSAGQRVDGVIVRDGAGEEIRVHANAVVIATGGFGGNAEWIKKYTGFELGRDLFSFAFPDVNGDGIRMAWDAGAARSDMILQTYVCLPEPYWGPGGTAFDLGTFRQPNLMVNLAGERFMNEETMKNPAYAANAVHRQRQGCGFMIFDERINRHYEENNWDFLMSKVPVTRSPGVGATIERARNEGYEHLFVANSIDELAAQTGIDPAGLQETLTEYNRACETGRDPLFHKCADYLRPVEQPRFYAARFYVGGYGSLGGIKINHRTEVLNGDDGVIAGLYAAGRDVNTIYGDTYMYALSGNDSAFDYNTGLVAGESAVGYVSKRQFSQ